MPCNLNKSTQKHYRQLEPIDSGISCNNHILSSLKQSFLDDSCVEGPTSGCILPFTCEDDSDRETECTVISANCICTIRRWLEYSEITQWSSGQCSSSESCDRKKRCYYYKPYGTDAPRRVSYCFPCNLYTYGDIYIEYWGELDLGTGCYVGEFQGQACKYSLNKCKPPFKCIGMYTNELCASDISSCYCEADFGVDSESRIDECKSSRDCGRDSRG